VSEYTKPMSLLSSVNLDKICVATLEKLLHLNQSKTYKSFLWYFDGIHLSDGVKSDKMIKLYEVKRT